MKISPSQVRSAKIAAGYAPPFPQHGRKAKESRSLMPALPDVAGHAALAICESLLLALNDHKILPEREILAVLKDAAAAHQNAPAGSGGLAMHQAVAALIQTILDGGNSVRHPVP